MIQLLLIRDSIKSVFKKYNAAIIPVLRSQFTEARILLLFSLKNILYTIRYIAIETGYTNRYKRSASVGSSIHASSVFPVEL